MYNAGSSSPFRAKDCFKHSDCYFTKHSAFRNENYECFRHDLKNWRSRIPASADAKELSLLNAISAKQWPQLGYFLMKNF
jgi:hypothetical protein